MLVIFHHTIGVTTTITLDLAAANRHIPSAMIRE
jgi:hypothetical protein